MEYHDDIKRLHNRRTALESERSSWVPTWREIGEHFIPRNGRYSLGQDKSRGQRKDRKILNNTTTRAVRTCSAGFHSGMSSPGKPWFRLKTQARLLKSSRVRKYLRDVEQALRDLFSASNLYRVLPQIYTEMAAFGTAAALIDKNLRKDGKITGDLADVIHFTMLSIGTYSLGTDGRGRLATCYRDVEMTVEQMVDTYGLAKVSDKIRTAYERHEYDTKHQIVLAIEPRRKRKEGSPLAKDMEFRSVAFELGCTDGSLLRDSGYRTFPGFAARWDVLVDDAYGSGPGMDAIGDARELQKKELRMGQVIDLKTRPPLQAPASLKNADSDLLPGGVTYYTATSANDGIRTAFEVNLPLPDLGLEINRTERRIEQAFYVDLFRMLENDMRSNITAREIAERHEEKLLAVGPVVERVENEVLRKIVDEGYQALIEADEARVVMGMEPFLPDPPPELEGAPLDIEFEGMLSQAVRAAEAAKLDRFLGAVGATAQLLPDVLDAVDGMGIVDTYHRMLGVDPDVLTDEERRRIYGEARAKAQAAIANAQQAKTVSEAERNMSQASSAAGGTDVAGALATANAIN